MEEPIEFDNVSQLLIKNFPDIVEDALFLNDDETALPYLVANDFARYIVKNINDNNIEEIKRCFEFIELLYINGTEKTKELATVGYLEDLQNMTGGNVTLKEYKIIFDYLGTESKKWWDKLNDFWRGNPYALKESLTLKEQLKGKFLRVLCALRALRERSFGE